MSLILPGSPAFTACSDNLAGVTPSNTAPGTNFTAGASNADGSAVSVLSALGHDVHYLIVGIGGINTNAVDSNALLDVLTDPAGGTSWGSFIDDLVCGFTTISGAVGFSLWYHFPIWIKSGTSIGVRARCAAGADITGGQVIIYAFGNPKRPEMWWCGSRVESLGINAASSKGTNITAGNSGAFGSWTSIGGTTTGRYNAVQFSVNGSDSSAGALGYHFQLGAGSAQLAGTPTFHMDLTINEAGPHNIALPIWCDIPAGTQLQMRGTCSGTAEVLNAAIYGVM